MVDKLLIIMYFFWLEDNWFFIGPPPLFQNSGSAPVSVGLCKTRGLHDHAVLLFSHRHKLGKSFCGHKYLKSQFVVAILNFSKITCTFPDGGWCDWKMWIISDFNCWVFAPTKKYEVHPQRPFWISVKPLKNHLHIYISWGMWFKIWIVSDFKF